MSGDRQPIITPVHRLDTLHHGRITAAALRDYNVGVRIQAQDFGLLLTVDEAHRLSRALSHAAIAASLGKLHAAPPTDLFAAVVTEPRTGNPNDQPKETVP